MNLNPVTEGIKVLSGYDRRSLLEIAGGLQLMPENADQSYRLEVFAHAAAGVAATEGAPTVSGAKLRRILNSHPFGEGAVAAWEDPFQNLFTEAFSFDGGPYLVLPGTCSESTFIMRELCKALFLSQSPFPEATFISRARALIVATLAVSNEVASRAGLERGTEPISRFRDSVIVPNAEQLSHLCGAVSFSRKHLEALLRDRNLSLASLEAIVLQNVPATITYDTANGTLLIKPIVSARDHYVVAMPGALLPAAWSAVLRLAVEFNVLDELGKRFNRAVWGTVVKCLDYLENEELDLPMPPQPPIACFQDSLFSLDSDKVMYAMLVTDPLSGYDAENPFGQWPTHGLKEEVERRLLQIEEWCLRLPMPPNDMLCLLLYHGIGRSMGIGIGRLGSSRFLALSAGELETISIIEAGNPLLLWKFAGAYLRLRADMKVQVLSILDLFNLYRKRGHCFYLNDERKPNLLGVAPDGAGPLRFEVARQRDFHSALWHDSDHKVDVTSLFGARDVPIFIPTRAISENIGEYAAVLVEGLALPIWVAGPVYGNGPERALHPIYAQFSETIAYWLWQFSPSMRSIFDHLSIRHLRLLLRLKIIPGDAWEVFEAASVKGDEIPVEVHSNEREGIVDLTLSPSVAATFQGPDNGGERSLMEYVLQGLRGILAETDHDQLSDSSINAIIDRHAPLGIKKKLLMIDTAANPQLDPDGLPAKRKVQDADENELLDELGEYLSVAGRLSEGPIPDTERTAVLNRAVLFYYEEMSKLVRSLNPEGLLETLISHQESLIRSSTQHRMTLPTRLACFGSKLELTKKIKEEVPENSKAGLASRFVIEYVVARPPNGIRPMSLSVYDRLQALASGILDFGFESDLIHFKLADIKLSMLPSGRLGSDRDDYTRAKESYFPVFAAGEIYRAMKGFHKHWRSPESTGEQPSEISNIDVASVAEFGVSISDIVSIVGEILSIGRAIHPSVPKLGLEELLKRLSSKLAWPSQRISLAVKILSLEPRADFLRPPVPYTREDVFPWKYSRSYSYLRRPLSVRKSRGGPEILWGPRMLMTALDNLLGLCLSGRLKCRSGEMRKLMGRFNHEQGEAFNDQTADLIESVSSFITRRRVKKIGNLRGSNGPPFGDIDVLVADPWKHRLICIECKDFSVARAPHELRNEIVELFEGRAGEPSAIKKQERRAKWLREHLKEVLEWFGIPLNGSWKVIPAIVVDRELMGPHIKQSAMKIISFRELREEIEGIR